VRRRCVIESRLITTYDEFLRLRNPWGELHRRANGSLFQLHDWLALWWTHYGSGRVLTVQTFWNDGLLVGVIPGFLDEKRLGGVSLRRLSMLGEEEIYGEYYPLVEQEYTEAIAQSAATYWIGTLRNGSADVIDFHGFPPESPFMNAFITWLRKGAYVRLVSQNLPHTVVEGATSGEGYLRLLSKRRRQSLQRHDRHLKEAGAEIEVVREWDGGKHFDDLVRLHQMRWERDGQPGRFGSPRFGEFLRSAAECLISEGKARMYFMRFGGERIAGLVTFDVNRQNCQYLVGRNPVHELMRYSVGEVLAMHAFVDAFNEGSIFSDLLGGDYQYKHYKGMTRRWYARATAIPAGVRSVKGAFYWAALDARDMLARIKRVFVHPAFDNRQDPEKP
jgi:CelD/BcsL family acetyltransferase involved in cellulose biosynthesis